jgi:hypothetical protein
MDPAILLLIVVFVLAPSFGMFMLAAARTPALHREVVRALRETGRAGGPAYDDGALAGWVPWRVPPGLEEVYAEPEHAGGEPVRNAVALWRANRRLAFVMLAALAIDAVLLALVVLWLAAR